MPPPRPSQMYYPNPIPDGITVPRIEELVSAIDSDSLEQILLQLAQQDTSGLVQSTLVNHYVQQAFEEQSEIIDFDHLSKRAWHAINSQYAGMSGSKQYDRSWDVTRDVVECIESIRGQVKEFSSFDTKVNALETLRKIAKTILLSGDVIGHEVRQHFQCESAFSEAVAEILDSMSEDECVAAGQNVSEVGKGTLLEKLEWVCAEAEDHCLEDLDVSEACARLRYDDPDEVTDEEYEKEDEGGGDDQDEEEDEDENQEDYEREMKDPPEETMDEATHQTRTRNRLTPLNSQLALMKSNIYYYGYAKEMALDALVNIGNLILMAEGSVVAKEIRAQLSHVQIIPELILSIVRSISESDRKAIGKEGRLTEDLTRLIAVAKGRAVTVYDCLGQAIEMLS
ncbi:unnamed protein product [Cercospora beticola]|nr:unnamed protein product [Cercospora beticola]